MGFPQYLIPPPFCQMKSQLSDPSLYAAVPSPACFGQQYCSLLVLVKGECLWIIRLCNLGGQVHLQNQRHLKLPAGFLVVCVDFATFVRGRRKTAACLLSCCFFAGCHEAECAIQWCVNIGDNSLPCFSSSHCPTVAKLGCVAWCTGPGAVLELLRDHRTHCCGPGQLGFFFLAFF